MDQTNLLAVSSQAEFNGTVDEVQSRLQRDPGVVDVAVVTSLVVAARRTRRCGGAYGDGQVPAGRWRRRAGVCRRPDVSRHTKLLRRHGHDLSSRFDVVGGHGARIAADRARRARGAEACLGTAIRSACTSATRLVKDIFTVIGVVPVRATRAAPKREARPSAYLRNQSPTRPADMPPCSCERRRRRRVSVPVIEAALKPLAPSSRHALHPHRRRRGSQYDRDPPLQRDLNVVVRALRDAHRRRRHLCRHGVGRRPAHARRSACGSRSAQRHETYRRDVLVQAGRILRSGWRRACPRRG